MNDEVDLLVAAWKRERPDLDVAPLEAVDSRELGNEWHYHQSS